MPVISVDKDLSSHTLTVTAQFAAPVERIWQVWADPRQLEKWWGPPTYPATVTSHALTPGGTVTYYMIGPDGERYGGNWSVRSVQPPRVLEFDDGFADAEGNPAKDMPVGRSRVELTEQDDGTRMTTTVTYATAEELQKVLDMGVIEGTTSAVAQIDALVSAA